MNTAQSRRTDRAAKLPDQPGDVRKPIAGDIPLSQIINPLVREGELYHALEDDAVRCVACGHECVIKPGGRGICQVRYNLGGKLYVPYEYVAALQCDPTEKKPFNHIYPGSDTLTFGMLGCDLHCSYCFTGDTEVITDQGPVAFTELFEKAISVEHRHDGDVASVGNLRTMTRTGNWQSVKAVFRHSYEGEMIQIKPYYLPPLSCTPDHRLYATSDPDKTPELTPARDVTAQHYLAIPRRYSFSSPQFVDVSALLDNHQSSYQIPWQLTIEEREFIQSATKAGQTSRQIGEQLGRRADYIRHVRVKIARGKADDSRIAGPMIEGQTIRFANEHRPGIPNRFQLDENFARLLGYFCAEGSIVRSNTRPNSYSLNFSFAPDEHNLANDTIQLLYETLGLRAALVRRETTLGVSVGKASASLLFEALAGSRAVNKRIPSMLFDAQQSIVEAFVKALVEGDGHRYHNGKVSMTTVSKALAYGTAWLVLKLGFLPSIYDSATDEDAVIMGRTVKRAPHQFTVVWNEDSTVERKVIETPDFYLVPIRKIEESEYVGQVFNMEVENEHNYLANFFLVSNCQNWDISQAMRDSNAGRPPEQVTPQELVTLAKRNGAKCVASSYNEPLITSEWAVAVFKEAQAAGFTCMYISNGNATREVLEYIRPYTDGYKIDLKTMREANYRKLGAVLENVLDGVKMVHEMGFWLEVVTLVIPGFNSSDDELRDAARFLKSLSADIPWHVTAFHKDYRMTGPDNTDGDILIHAAEIGREEGLNYVYAGNLPGRVGPYEHTYCPHCHATLIERFGYVVLSYAITPEGTCPHCQTKIPGLWPKSASEVRLGSPADLYFRVPRPVR